MSCYSGRKGPLTDSGDCIFGKLAFYEAASLDSSCDKNTNIWRETSRFYD